MLGLHLLTTSRYRAARVDVVDAHNPINHPDYSADRCSSNLALQYELGILSGRRFTASGHPDPALLASVTGHVAPELSVRGLEVIRN